MVFLGRDLPGFIYFEQVRHPELRAGCQSQLSLAHHRRLRRVDVIVFELDKPFRCSPNKRMRIGTALTLPAIRPNFQSKKLIVAIGDKLNRWQQVQDASPWP